MPPIGDDNRIRPNSFHSPRIEPKPQPTNQPQVTDTAQTNTAERRSNFQFYGSQQRDRLERLYGAGAAGMSNSVFAYRGRAFQEASLAYHRVIAAEVKNFGAGSNTIEITNKALAEYRRVLNSYGVKPGEAPSSSILNATDFLRSESTRAGNLFTLDGNAVRGLAATGETPQYFARMMLTGDKPIGDAGQRLAYYEPAKQQGKTIAWATTVEDLAGTRMDYREVMSRIGWTADDIAKANPKDFKVIVFTQEAVSNPVVPSERAIIDLAKADTHNFSGVAPTALDNFVGYRNYETRKTEAATLGIDLRNNLPDFLRTLPPSEQPIFQARFQLENTMGVNPLFTGDGTTMRPDAVNGRVGGREFVVNNTVDSATLLEMTKKGQVAFLDLHDHNTTGAPVDITNQPAGLPVLTERQMLASETKHGAIIGGTLSAVTSLPQVFEQYQSGDHLGAVETFTGHTALGTGVGALSSAGERVVGNKIATTLSRSSAVQQGVDRLFTNGAARGFVSRMAGTEASSITSQTFGATVRTVAGRVGGAGIVGGLVNGGFSAYDQIGAYKRGEVTASQAIGTVTGETAVGVGAGMAGAAAGAAIGSIIPGAGTIVGGVIGFGVGMLAGYLADKGLRGIGVDKMIAGNVTAMIDNGAKIAGQAQEFGREAVNTFNNAVDSVKSNVGNTLNNVGHAFTGSLQSIFG